MNNRVAVLGAGSWGTVFAKVLCDAGTDVAIWGRRPAIVDAINERRENPDYLPGVALPESLRATGDPAEALDGAAYVMLAVPAQTLRANLSEWVPLISSSAVLVSLMKGIELATCKRMSEVIARGRRPASGTGRGDLRPEPGTRDRRGSAVGGRGGLRRRGGRQTAPGRMHAPYFRAYTNTDVIGCELGGTVKNVIALAVGIAVGMGFGDNVRATLMTRGLAEIARLGAALGADQHTFAGLAGMGDLVATCSSPLSRNRTFGENLGRGMTLEQVIAATKQTAEGVKSCDAVLELAR